MTVTSGLPGVTSPVVNVVTPGHRRAYRERKYYADDCTVRNENPVNFVHGDDETLSRRRTNMYPGGRENI